MAYTFPNNMIEDFGIRPIDELPEDIFPSIMYVLHSITSERNVNVILSRYRDNKTLDEIGKEYGFTRQMAQLIIQKVKDEFSTVRYRGFLEFGVIGYTTSLMESRVEELLKKAEDAEKKKLINDAFTEGYNLGFAEGSGQNSTDASKKPLDLFKIKDLDLSVRTANALTRSHVKTLGDVVEKGDLIMTLPSFGKGCFIELATMLNSSYGVNIEKTFPRTTKKFDWRAKDAV